MEVQSSDDLRSKGRTSKAANRQDHPRRQGHYFRGHPRGLEVQCRKRELLCDNTSEYRTADEHDLSVSSQGHKAEEHYRGSLSATYYQLSKQRILRGEFAQYQCLLTQDVEYR